MLTDEILTAAPVSLAMVTLFATLVVPKAWFPKAMLVAESLNCVTAVPVELTVCGLLLEQDWNS